MLAGVLLAWTTEIGPLQVASVQADKPPRAITPTITVVGKRPDEPISVVGPAIDRYVSTLRERWTGTKYFASGHDFNIWPRHVCLNVQGLEQQSKERFEQMLAPRLAEVGVEVSGVCGGAVTVIFTSQMTSLIHSIQLNPRIANYYAYGGDISDLSKFNLPIKWLETTRYDDLYKMTIIIDGSQIGKIDPTSLVDYVAFVMLAAPRNDPVVPGVFSIVNLFQENSISSTSWTQLDKAFLKALYSFQDKGSIDNTELRNRVIIAYAQSAEK